MKIRIICVGKLKEKFYRDACQEYIKRLGAFAKIEIIEHKDEKVPDNYSDEEIRKAVGREGSRILARLGSGPAIALDLNGDMPDSVQFSEQIAGMMQNGSSTIDYIIGGSNGLSPEVLSACSRKISFSRMTFPHQLFRVMLLEQLYRAFKIMRGGTYHK